MLTVGAFMFALAVSLFLNPLKLAPGGISGISVIINRLTGFPTGTMLLILNIPILIIAFFKFGYKLFLSTMYVLGIQAIFTDLIMAYTGGRPIITENLLLAGVAGATIMAIGIGTIFRCGGTTGGVDIIVKMLRKKYRHINTGTIFFVADFCVIVLSAIAFRDIEIALYALIVIFINSRVLDFVLYGMNHSKLVYIISDNYETISKRLTNELDLGATILRGEGAYTGRTKNMLLCAVKNHAFPDLRRMVREEDPKAFLIVSDTTEIFGEGYDPIEKEEL